MCVSQTDELPYLWAAAHSDDNDEMELQSRLRAKATSLPQGADRELGQDQGNREAQAGRGASRHVRQSAGSQALQGVHPERRRADHEAPHPHHGLASSGRSVLYLSARGPGAEIGHGTEGSSGAFDPGQAGHDQEEGMRRAPATPVPDASCTYDERSTAPLTPGWMISLPPTPSFASAASAAAPSTPSASVAENVRIRTTGSALASDAANSTNIEDLETLNPDELAVYEVLQEEFAGKYRELQQECVHLHLRAKGSFDILCRRLAKSMMS